MSENNKRAPRPPALTGAQRRALRAQAHHLKAVVWVGQNGLTEPVAKAIQIALNDHELIKVSLSAGSSKERKVEAASVGEETGSLVVQVIGKVGVFYRRKKNDPVVKIPGKLLKEAPAEDDSQ
jgi:RNA-binding protein